FNAIAAPNTDALKRSSWCRIRVTRSAWSAEPRWNRGRKAPTFRFTNSLNVPIRSRNDQIGKSTELACPATLGALRPWTILAGSAPAREADWPDRRARGPDRDQAAPDASRICGCAVGNTRRSDRLYPMSAQRNLSHDMETCSSGTRVRGCACEHTRIGA